MAKPKQLSSAILWVPALLVLSLCCSLPYIVKAQHGPAAGQAVSRPPERVTQSNALADPWHIDESQNVLIVTLLDGTVVGVDTNSGARLWSFDSGAPLVSVRHSEAAGGVNIFPGVDGSLYAYHGIAGSGQPQLERLPMSMPDLVSASPSVAVDGSVVLGTRASTVYAIDRTTGKLVKLLSGIAGALSEAGTDGIQIPTMLDPASMVLLGREDYVVRSMHAASGEETWNATFARVSHLHPLAPRQPQPQMTGFTKQSKLGSAKAPRMAVGPDNTLQAYDPVTGLRRWSLKFDTPPIAAFDSGLGSTGANQLDPRTHHRQSHKLPPGSKPTLPASSHAGKAAAGMHEECKHVMVGVLYGSLYAVPTDHLSCMPVSDEMQTSGAVAQLPGSLFPSLPGQTDIPALPGPQTGSKGANGSSKEGTNGGPDEDSEDDSTAVAVVPDQKTLTVMKRVAQDATPNVAALVCPLGVHELSPRRDNGAPNCSAQHIPWLPAPPAPALLPDKATVPARAPRWHMGVLLGTAGVAGLLLLVGLLWARSYSINLTQPSSKPATGLFSPSKLLDADQAGNPTAMEAWVNAAKSTHDQVSHDHIPSEAAKGKHKGKSKQAGARKRLSKISDYHDSDVSTEPDTAGIQRQETVLESSKAHPVQSAEASNGTSSGRADTEADESSRLPPAPAYSSRMAQPHPDGTLRMGKLRIGPGILGYGSAGTIVYEGVLDGRPVAVKRLLRQFYDLARKEIEVLILSDEHPNVVRCFAMEEDREFVYLALERCRSTLAEALAAPQGRAKFLNPSGTGPTEACVEVMRQVVAGLTALHKNGIVHRDLKPQNVLLTNNGCAKLSDMGLSKQLVAEQSSFESHGAGGSSGWQAPEQLMARQGHVARQTRNMDIFSLGCVLYYCMTGGKHPFGESYERDSLILRGQPNMVPLASSPEATNLVATMLTKEAELRPSMAAVSGHPMWWGKEKRLQFLIDISDRVENEDREPDQTLLAALESHARTALQPPTGGQGVLAGLLTPNWGTVVDPELVANLGRYRRYDYTSLRDLLRVVRNKRNHFREMPANLQVLLGPVPEGYLRYFTSRFPLLLMSCWVFALHHLSSEKHMQDSYFSGDAQHYELFTAAFFKMHPQRTAVAATTAATSTVSATASDIQQLAANLRKLSASGKTTSPSVPAVTVVASTATTSTVKTTSNPGKAATGGSVTETAMSAGESSGSNHSVSSANAWNKPVVSNDATGGEAGTPTKNQAMETEVAGLPPGETTPAKPANRYPDINLPDSLFSSPEIKPTRAGNANTLVNTSPPGNNVAVEASAVLLACTSFEGTSTGSATQAMAVVSTSSNVSSESPAATAAAATAQAAVIQVIAAQPVVNPAAVVVGYQVDEEADEDDYITYSYPQRPGVQLCDFYSKTGHCRYGVDCIFDHPQTYQVKLTNKGLPMRPGQPICAFYIKSNQCKFGPACKFHHPYLKPIYAGEGAAAVAELADNA